MSVEQVFSQRFGSSEDPTVLLLAGNGCSSVYWPDDFCSLVVDAGFSVIRFDYRDTGKSPHDGEPYALLDLAIDALELLDAHQVRRLHLVGLSMGGFIAQFLATVLREAVLSITSLMSTSDYATMLHTFSGAPAPTSGLPPPSAAWLAELGKLSPSLSHRELMLESWRLAVGDAAFDRDEWSALLDLADAHGDDARAGERHREACARHPQLNLLDALGSVEIPALFIEGANDPIFPTGHAAASARAAKNGRMLRLEGIGHGLTRAFHRPIADALIEHFKRAP